MNTQNNIITLVARVLAFFKVNIDTFKNSDTGKATMELATEAKDKISASAKDWKETEYNKKTVKTAALVTLVTMSPILFIIALLVIGLIIKYVPKIIILIVIAGIAIRVRYKRNLKKAAQEELLDAIEED